MGSRGRWGPAPSSLAPPSCLDADVGVTFEQRELKSLLWKEGNGWGQERRAPGLPFLSLPPEPPAASLTFTVTFARGSGGTSGWQGPPSCACQHSVASAGREHGASSRQSCEGSSCNRAARQRFLCARGSAERESGHRGPVGSRLPPSHPGRAGPLTLPKRADAGPDGVGFQRPHLDRKRGSAVSSTQPTLC